MGSNDYLNNYFMSAVYLTSQQYTQEQYADAAGQYSQNLRTLYSNGAWKVALIGVGQVGCSPNKLAQRTFVALHTGNATAEAHPPPASRGLASSAFWWICAQRRKGDAKSNYVCA
jgi:hypothetical protein